MSAPATGETVLPPTDQAEIDSIADFVSQAGSSAPGSLRKLLAVAGAALASGSAVRVEAVSTLVGTGRAAELLNVSRPTLVKLLEEGRIPHERPSVRRMVRLEDVLAYKAARTKGRLGFLDALAAEAAETGEADMSLGDYADAIESTRHGGGR
ncbi:MAG: excisionase family DNA-binding protein [Bifidobacteriaceae bacterium]|jgi:excisionase family DNA binding protein|nr:excisionase family DNA-binding protein [Bifidobacteriaceae bacterium]